MSRAPWLLLALLAACGVPRAEPRPVDAAAFPTEANLLRAREALQDRIAREREHVAALKQQLAGLRDEEDRLYATYLAAEGDYQLREKDLAGVESDLARVQQALADTQARVHEAEAQVAQAQASLAALLGQAQAILDALARLDAALREGRAADLAEIMAGIPPQFLPPAPAAPEPEPAPAPEPEPEPPPEPEGDGGSEGGGAADSRSGGAAWTPPAAMARPWRGAVVVAGA